METVVSAEGEEPKHCCLGGVQHRIASLFPGCVSSTTQALFLQPQPPPPFHADRRSECSKPQIHLKSSPGMICCTDRGMAAYLQTGRAVSSFLNVNQEPQPNVGPVGDSKAGLLHTYPPKTSQMSLMGKYAHMTY